MKGIKSYLTLSGGSRSRGQTVHHVLDTTDFTLPRGHPPRIRQGDFVVSLKDYNWIECIKRKDDAPAGQDKSGSRGSLRRAAVAQYSEIKTSEITKLNHKTEKDQKDIVNLKDNNEHEETEEKVSNEEQCNNKNILGLKNHFSF